jgi:hypothetical protein
MSLLALPRHFSTIEPSNAPVLRSVHGLRVVIGRKRGLSLIPPYALMVGVPARHIGWLSEHGEQMPLPLTGEGSWVCPQTGARYALRGDRICRQDVG